MSILSRFLIAILFCAGISIVSFAADDAWDTKSVGQKIADLGSDDPKIRREANDALSNLAGIVCDPIDLTAKDDPIAELEKIRTAVTPHLKEIKDLLESPHQESRATAIMLLGVIGPDAGETIPELLQILRTSKLTDGLSDESDDPPGNEPDVGLTAMATYALLHVTPVDKPIGPTLLEIYAAAGGGQELEDESDAIAELGGSGIVAVAIARALVASGRTMIELPTLVELTNRKYRKGVRAIALATLGQLEFEAKPALPALRELLVDKDADIRMMAGGALIFIQGNLDELPAVTKTLGLGENESKKFKDELADIRRRHDELVNHFHESAAECIPLFSRGLKSTNPFYQRSAIRSLGEIGPAAKAVIPDLIEFTKSNVEATREAALLAIKQIDPTKLPADSGNMPER